ncbi:MAG: glycerate kinase [Lentilitoribacter sp.]
MSSCDKIIAELKSLFHHGLGVADPINCIPPHLPQKPRGRVLVISAGKAAASMAHAVEQKWGAGLEGIAVTRYGHGKDCQSIEVIEAAHPVPDNRGEIAAKRLLEVANTLEEDDLLLCLISGGGSALLGLAAEGLTFEDKKAINKALLASGAPIGEMNIVRKHLSAIKGGRLAKAAYPAKILTMAISDVPGDDPSVIASGPTVPDESTSEQAIEIIDRYGISIPKHVRAHLENPTSETPKPGDEVFEKSEVVMVARPVDMVNSVCEKAESQGYNVINLGADIEGEAKEVGQQQAKMALDYQADMKVGDKPIVIISGGETTVTITGEGGKGGRNCEYILSLAVALNGAENIHALACDTDGIDGSEDVAGAIITPNTLKRAKLAGYSAQEMLAKHDSYTLFQALGDLYKTGPTLTNVNDLRVIYITKCT